MRRDLQNAAWELRFRPRGAGRFAGAAFLLVWLGGWLVGETVVIAVLATGAWALATGGSALGGDEPLRLAPALAAGLFLLLWLTLWTVGGVAAIREFLRQVWGEDRLLLLRDELIAVRRYGPFTTTQRLPRREILRVFLPASGRQRTALMALHGARTVELTDLGTPEERAAGASRLQAALGLTSAEPASHRPSLPERWEEILSPTGQTLLVPNLRTRRIQSRLVTGIALVAGMATFLLIRESLRDPNVWVVTLMVGTASAWVGWQARKLARSREEWRLERGRLVLQRRSGGEVIELTASRATELVESSDSDGDRWYELRAIELTPLAGAHKKSRGSVRLHQAIHHATEGRALGEWIARRTNVPFHDRVPDEAARRAELEALREDLARTGKLGALAARMLDRVAPKKD